MNKYNYSAINELGKKVHGKIEAQDKDAAFIALRKQFPTVTSVEEPGALDGLMDMDVGSKKIKPSKLSLLCSQYAIILKSGTPVGDATKLLAEQQKDKKLKKLLDAVYSDILAGRDISAAFERNANVAVQPTFIATLISGEGT
jgi:type IV pilus assembly protein PilC